MFFTPFDASEGKYVENNTEYCLGHTKWPVVVKGHPRYSSGFSNKPLR